MRRQPSIRVLAAVVGLAPVVVVSLLLATLSILTANRIAEDLGAAVADAAVSSVRSQVARYLDSAVRVSNLYVRRIEGGRVPTSGSLQAWEPLMLNDLLVHLDVASICFANEAGESTWLLRGPGRLEVGRATGTGADEAVEYVMHSDGTPGALIRQYQYVAPQRPWYQVAVASPEPRWTPIYFWFGDTGPDSTVGSGYTRAIRDEAGQVVGVLVIDVTLASLSEFLQTLPLAERGYMFVLDEHDLLVATSHGNVNSETGQRLSIAQASGTAATAVAAALGQWGDQGAGQAMRRIDVQGMPARLRVAPLQPYPGIEWRIVAVLPESAFLAQATAARRRAVVLSLVALIGGVMLALTMARQMARPLFTLIAHVRRLGGGDLDSRLELHVAREFSELSRAVNRMADDLKDRLELQQAMRVAQQVQQSLLPAQTPQLPQLEVVGRSHYCETTGGDYYDFIDAAGHGGDGALIAVGDVMGHGIGAALLMASARATLRTHCLDEPDLGKLLRRMNHVLLGEARHYRFVTMVLLSLQPATGTLRWACAGHDLPLVFDPECGQFTSLDGGDVPLGIEPSVPYQQYQRACLRPGTVLFIGTDGVWETTNAAGQMFGRERLSQLLKLSGGCTAAQISDRLEQALTTFRGDQRATDDTTFVVIRVLSAAGDPAAANGQRRGELS